MPHVVYVAIASILATADGAAHSMRYVAVKPTSLET